MADPALIGRRALGWLVAGAAPALAQAAAPRSQALVIGLDIADTATFDPARQISYTPPLTLAACYDTLVTMAPDRYEQPIPCLATSWTLRDDSAGWRFRLRSEATFASGNPVTPADVAFSLNRLQAVGDLPAQFLPGLTGATATGADTVDLMFTDAAHAPIAALAATTFAILERSLVEAHGGTADADAATADAATAWLNQHSAGSGPYALASWAPRQRIVLEANPRSWRGPPAFARIEIRHMPTSTEQMQALLRGDIDAAFNLIPEHVVQLGYDSRVRIDSADSLDLVFLALNADAKLNPALASSDARRAVAFAIDYEAILDTLLGHKAIRPATFLPIGLPGSTLQTAQQIGFRQDLDLSRTLLASAGLADGFALELSYPDTGVAGLSYATLARRLRNDLGRVGIAVTPVAMHPASWRSAFFNGTLASTLAFWTAPTPDSAAWGHAAVDVLAPRIGFVPSPTIRDAALGTDVLIRARSDGSNGALSRPPSGADAQADAGWRGSGWSAYELAMVSLAQVVVLLQPTYQVAVRKTVAALPLTGAGWLADLREAKPESAQTQ